MAKALAAAGAKVVISDLQEDAGEKVADALAASTERATASSRTT